MLLSVHRRMTIQNMLTLKSQTINQLILKLAVLMLKSLIILPSVEENPV
uniref:Pco097918 n=1 Tax=Arundo donax TaxID=35708 RepID=A0A0A9EVQ8_ARUDO